MNACRWRKIGRVWDPEVRGIAHTTHSGVPVPVIFDDRVRVLYSARDSDGRSCGAWFDFRPDQPDVILDAANTPNITSGSPGFFDDAGAMPSTAWWQGETLQMLYVGWNLGRSVPFRNAIGLAASTDGGRTFVKYSDGPVMDRSPVDPAFVASPFVLPGSNLRLWYSSCVEWLSTQNGPRHRYHLKFAESADGVHWQREGVIAVDFVDKHEYAMSRPFVVDDGGVYRMWFCSRGDSFRIQYAESRDGRVFTRHPGVALDVSRDGWDSEMTAYPAVFDWEGQRYMLYNGNGYGRSGIGLAVLDDSQTSP